VRGGGPPRVGGGSSSLASPGFGSAPPPPPPIHLGVFLPYGGEEVACLADVIDGAAVGEGHKVNLELAAGMGRGGAGDGGKCTHGLAWHQTVQVERMCSPPPQKKTHLIKICMACLSKSVRAGSSF
jgi:hypothetical protein